MANKKTSIKRRKRPTKSTPNKVALGGGVYGELFSPTEELANPHFVAEALVEAFMDGDKEAFQDILAGFLRAREITKTAKEMKISRTVIYEAMDKTKNPSLESLCKIMKAFKEAKIKAA